MQTLKRHQRWRAGVARGAPVVVQLFEIQMIVQPLLAWAVLIVCAALAVYGSIAGGIFTQPVWTGNGFLKMAAFLAAYSLGAGLMAWKRPRWLFPALGFAVVGYSMVAVGPVAVLAVLWMGAGCFSTAAWILRGRTKFLDKNPQAVLILGLAVWTLLICATARWPLHRGWVYWLILGVPILQALRYRLLRALVPVMPEEPASAGWAALAALPAVLHWVVALKPEVSSDGLAMHLTVAARMGAHHKWGFDATEFIWALMPMNGDWVFSMAYLLGGEAAARLANAALLAVICWLLYKWLHELVPARMAALLTAGFGTTPLVQLVTGSLFVENVAAAFFLGMMVYFRRYLKGRQLGDAMACAALAGAAAGTKLASVGLLVPFGLAALMSFSLRHALAAAALGILSGSLPYLEAMVRSGNPVFPFLNQYFRSPLFTMTGFTDARFATPMNWRTWYDLTIDSSRFIEGRDGAFGFLIFLLAPLAVVAAKRTWPSIALTALWVSVPGMAIIYTSASNLRYLYPALPLLMLAAGAAVAALRAYSVKLERAVAVWCGVSIVAHLVLLPSAGWYHTGFMLNQVFDKESVENYLAVSAPERPLVEHLAREAPTSSAAWFDSGAVAGFPGRTYNSTWHSHRFSKELRDATAAEGILYLAEKYRIDYFIAPSAANPKPATNVFTREFLDLYTAPVRSFAGWELRKRMPIPKSLEQLSQPFARPGVHDELNSFVRYEGPWVRDLQFKDAYRGTLTYTSDTRSKVHIRFEGRSITPLYTAASNRCRALLSVDGGEDLEFNQYSSTTVWQYHGPKIDVPPGFHTLTMRLPQTPDAASKAGQCFMDLDGFIVE